MYPNLKHLIKCSRLTQTELGAMLGICRNSVSNKLHGHTQWKAREMETIREYLAPGMHMETIFSREFTIGVHKLDTSLILNASL